MLPDGVKTSISGQDVNITGPKGSLSISIHPNILVAQEGNSVVVQMNDTVSVTSDNRALWGSSRALIANMVHGVTEGYEKKLEVHGVGYKAGLSGSTLTLHVGYSHPVSIEAPEGISFAVDGNTITVSGIDKQLVGETAARIRRFRKPEPYKGKGVRYQDEHVRRKVGKVAGGTTT